MYITSEKVIAGLAAYLTQDDCALSFIFKLQVSLKENKSWKKNLDGNNWNPNLYLNCFVMEIWRFKYEKASDSHLVYLHGNTGTQKTKEDTAAH